MTDNQPPSVGGTMADDPGSSSITPPSFIVPPSLLTDAFPPVLPPDAQRKRQKFLEKAAEAATAMETAAKRIKLAANAARTLAESHPECLGAADASLHMDELTKKAASTWAMALEGKVVLQETAVITAIRDKQDRHRRLDRQRVAEVMDIRDPDYVWRLD